MGFHYILNPPRMYAQLKRSKELDFFFWGGGGGGGGVALKKM